MSQFLTLLKIEFLSNRNRTGKGGKIFPRIFKALVLLLGVGVIGGVVLFAFNSVIKTCLKADIGNEFLVFFIFLVQIAQLLFGLSITTKTLYFSSDLDLMKLPIKGITIFLSKCAYLYIKEFIFSLLIGVPVFIEYGILSGQGAGFYAMIPLVSIIFPMIPFLFSLILSVPMMYAVGYLKNKFIVMLVIYILIVAGGFFLYSSILKFILAILQSGDASSIFSSQLVMGIKTIASYLYVPILLKNLLVGYRFFVSVLVVISFCCFFLALILVFANKIYLRILLKNSEENHSFRRKIKVKERSVPRALFFREFLTIFRSSNYSFQYLTIVITTPLMVYFSNSIASNIGVESIGKGVLPGISVLVLIMFLTMGTSFAATSITREGGNFFHTKIIPVTYRKQVFVKFMLYVIVAIPSVFISCLVLALFGFLGFLDAFLIALAVVFVIVGNISNSIALDIKRPQFMYLDGKEVTQTTKNVSQTLSQGFIIAALMGVGGIIVSLFVSIPSIYLVLFGFSVPYVAVETFRLFYKIEDRYRRIEA